MRVACIGECMVEFAPKDDLYIQGFAGDTLNVAIYLKRYLPSSSQVSYVTAVGCDHFSDKLMGFFAKHHLDTTCIYTHPTKTLGLYTIAIEEGERSFSYWRNDAAAKTVFDDKHFDEVLMGFDCWYFSAITLAILTPKGRSHFMDLLAKAKQKGITIAFDSNYRPKLYESPQEAQDLYKIILPYVDIFLPSVDDEMALWGTTKAQTLDRLQALPCREVVIKCAKDEVVFTSQGQQGKVAITPVKPVDTTAAGDSFNGGFLAKRLMGAEVEHAIFHGSEVAKTVIMHHGAIV